MHWQCDVEQSLQPNGTSSRPSPLSLLDASPLSGRSEERACGVDVVRGASPLSDLTASLSERDDRNSFTIASLALLSTDTSFSNAWHRSRHQVISDRHCSTSRERLVICSLNAAMWISCSSSIFLICSSSSLTRAARRSLKARWAALF